MVFAASAYGAGGGLVKLSKVADGGVTAEEVWFSSQMENHHGGVFSLIVVSTAPTAAIAAATRLSRFPDRQRPVERA